MCLVCHSYVFETKYPLCNMTRLLFTTGCHIVVVEIHTPLVEDLLLIRSGHNIYRNNFPSSALYFHIIVVFEFRLVKDNPIWKFGIQFEDYCKIGSKVGITFRLGRNNWLPFNFVQVGKDYF